MILGARFNGYRPYTENSGSFIQAVAADDSTVSFRHDAPEARVGEHRRKQANSNPGFRQFGRESVVGVDLDEGLVTNAPTRWSVLWTRPSNQHLFHRLATLG
jgi:hypothetical protein